MKQYRECPVCKQTNSFDTGRPTNNRITNWIGHIKSKARSEIFDREFFGDKRKVPHFRWLKKHTQIVPANKIIYKSR